jgi:(2Fe-2S) ferredoxin
MINVNSTFYVTRIDGEYYVKTTNTESIDRFFEELAHTICFADCSDEQVVFISYEGKELHYTGWKPNMLMEFADEANEIIYSQSFPEWDH